MAPIKCTGCMMNAPVPIWIGALACEGMHMMDHNLASAQAPSAEELTTWLNELLESDCATEAFEVTTG